MVNRAFVLALAAALAGSAATAQAAQISNFPADSTTGWNLTIPDGLGATVPSLVTTASASIGAAPDGGAYALYVAAGGEATYSLPNQGSGDLTMYVYDPGTATTLTTDYGPRWGITSPDGTAPLMMNEQKAGGFGGGNYSAFYRAGSGGGLDVTDPTVLWSRASSAGLGRQSGAWIKYDFNINTTAGTMTITAALASSTFILGTTGSTVAADNIPNNTTWSGSGSDLSPEWESAANGGTGPVGIGNVEIYGGNVGSQLGGTYIDDVSWTPAAVPEPASLAILTLGAGGLLLSRRRRA